MREHLGPFDPILDIELGITPQSIEDVERQLIEMTPWLRRRACIARNMVEMDFLLDTMINMNKFDEVFNG